jgi:hypothetical protein
VTRAFAATGAIATAASLAVFALVLAAGGEPVLATALRLATALPILYAGYSRHVLGATLAAERAARGPVVAELRMVGRVAAAIGTSAALKLALEPVLASWLLAIDLRLAALAPLAGDLGYGPLVSYLVLRLGARGRRHTGTG